MTNYYFYSIILFVMIVWSLKIKQNNDDNSYTYDSELSVRGILILLVIFNHAFENAYLIGNIAVSLFFCFSGYGLIKGYRKNGQKYFRGGYWKRKIESLILPYFLINVLYILYDIFILGKKYDLKNIASSFFTAEIMTVGWYTIVIFLLYFIFYLVYHVLKVRENRKIFVLCALEILLMIFLFLVGCGSWWYCSIFAFIVGIAKGENLFLIEQFMNKIGVTIFAVMFIGIYGLTSHFGICDGIVFLVIKMWMSISICIIYYGLFKKIEIKNEFLRILGKNSFIIYLIHPMFARVWQYVGLDDRFELLFVACQVIFSLVFSLSYQKIVCKIKEK